MIAPASEAALAALAYASLPAKTRLSRAERALVKNPQTFDARTIAALRKAITAGADPLGDAFLALRSPETRRTLGAVYTPPAIIAAMIAWASAQPQTPARIVDPGAGSGRFLFAAAQQFPNATLTAVEIDPLAALILRATAHVLGLADRLTLEVQDYRAASLPKIKGTTLFIGNPPYVRHHDIAPEWKDWYAACAKTNDLPASKLAGLHLHFFLRTKELACPGDLGAFITASEWTDINYGATLRKMLANGLGGSGLHLIDASAQPFADALVTGAITTFNVGRRPEAFMVSHARSIDALASLTHGTPIPWTTVEKADRWSRLLDASDAGDDTITLGDLCRAHRGQVTGANDVWVVSPSTPKLPASLLLPAVTSARELIAASPELKTTKALARVIDLPRDLASLAPRDRKLVDKFLAWAKKQGADKSYIARHRNPWWHVRYKEPAPILVTYMGRRPPVFVLNTAGARHLNIAHGLYPKEPLTEPQLKALVAHLNTSVSTADGRTYAGGLVKFEPKELERLRIPRLAELHDAAEGMDERRAQKRRAKSPRELPRASSR